jgi:hypothetical protein
MNSRIPFISILGVALVSLLLSVAYLNTCGDDSFIYFRLIENFLRTGQLEYNAGEPCYAMTSVTFFFLFSGLARELGLDGGRYAISLLGHVFAVVTLLGLGRRLIRSRTVLMVVMAAILFDPFYLRWFWAGWEMSFKIGAAALALWMLLVVGERSRGGLGGLVAGLAMGFAVLTRPEMLFLAVLGAIYLVARGGAATLSRGLQALGSYVCGLFLLVGPWMLFAKSYFGWALPHTVYAKAGGVCSWAYLQTFLPKFIQILFMPALPVYLLTLLVALSVRRWAEWKKLWSPGWSPDGRDFLLVAIWASTVAGYLVRSVYIDGIKIGLFSPFVVMSAGSLLDSCLRLRDRKWSWKTAIGWMAVLLLLSVGVQAKLFYRFSSWNPRYAQGDDANFIAFAKRVKDLTPPTARIGLSELGVVGYFSGRYMIDYVGLATPQLVTYQLESSSKEAAVEKYHALHGGPADYMVQEFRFSPDTAPETVVFWGHRYRLVDFERVTRIAGRTKKGEFSIYALYGRIPEP